MKDSSSLLLEKVCVDAWFAVRNDSSADSCLIKLNGPGAADDSIDIAKLAQSPQRSNQQSLADAFTAFGFGDAGWTKESLARALVPGKTNHARFARCDVKRHGFAGKGDGNFIGPCD